MSFIVALADALYREEVARARRMAPGDKLLEGPRLFDRACYRWQKAFDISIQSSTTRVSERFSPPGWRTSTNSNSPRTPYNAVVAVVDALEALSVRYMIVGSLASNFHGIPRSTRDADFVVELAPGAWSASQTLCPRT